MNTMKTKHSLTEAQAVANELGQVLIPFCERIVVAGSIRRRKPLVGDVEILYVPRIVNRPVPGDMFKREDADAAEAQINAWLLQRIISKRPSKTGIFTWGALNKLATHTGSGIGVDFFATTQANWWVSLVIRTGGKETNLKLTNGAIRIGRKLNAYGCGVTESDGNVIPATSEEHVFELCGVPYLAPEERI